VGTGTSSKSDSRRKLGVGGVNRRWSLSCSPAARDPEEGSAANAASAEALAAASKDIAALSVTPSALDGTRKETLKLVADASEEAAAEEVPFAGIAAGAAFPATVEGGFPPPAPFAVPATGAAALLP
jgi:hypothetical protein